MIMIGWGQGFQPICAMNWGAGQYGRVKKALFISAAFGTIFLIIAAIVLALTAQKVSGLFSKDSDVSALAAVILRLQCISLPVMGIYALCSMFMQNTGHYFSALLISIARQGIFYIPLLFTLPPLFTLAGHRAQRTGRPFLRTAGSRHNFISVRTYNCFKNYQKDIPQTNRKIIFQTSAPESLQVHPAGGHPSAKQPEPVCGYNSKRFLGLHLD